MKTVTTPITPNPFIADINGVKYTYPANSEVTVPDEIAALIEVINAQNNVTPRKPAIVYGETTLVIPDEAGDKNIIIVENGKVRLGKISVSDNTLIVE